MNRTQVARTVSTVGHPAIVIPSAAAGSALWIHGDGSVAALAGCAGLLVSCVVLGYSLVRVRSGAWDHVDASRPVERVRLNALLVLVLSGVALAASLSGSTALAAGSAACGAVVLLALLMRSRLKLSLHVAFAVLASTLWWPWGGAVLTSLALAAAVAWSRLELGRHTPGEVAAGIVVGTLAGVAFNVLGMQGA